MDLIRAAVATKFGARGGNTSVGPDSRLERTRGALNSAEYTNYLANSGYE